MSSVHGCGAGSWLFPFLTTKMTDYAQEENQKVTKLDDTRNPLSDDYTYMYEY